jgi:hypothetical protein
MFVRDGNSNPREIAKIFVRDAAGNPQEISKIYVRDAAGNPKLVFDNTVIIVENFCPTCGNTIFRIEPVAQPATPATVSNRIRLTNEGGSTFVESSISTGPAFVNSYTVDKNYWSKVAISSEHTYVTEIAASTGTFVAMGPSGTINNVRRFDLQAPFNFSITVPTEADYELSPKGTWYWNNIKTGFDTLINYPILPGHIIVDWNTYTIRDTFLVVMKDPQRTFTSHCGSPVAPDNSQPPRVSGCPETGVRSSSIYPFHNRTIITKVQEFDSSNIFSAKCGQNYCFDVFSTVFSSAASECFNQRLIQYVDPAGTIVTGNCTGGIDGAGSTGIGKVGTDITCDSAVFINWDEVNEGIINPFSFIVNKENHGTGRTLPTQLANAAVQDCCPSTCYGPVKMKITDFLSGTESFTACRQVYQIPPINTINTDGTDRLGFFENIYTSLLMGAESIVGTPGIGSAANIRIVLPCYVTLHSDYTTSIASIFPQQYDAFVRDGAGPAQTNPATQAREVSVWNAIKSFFPFIPGTTDISPPANRSWLSSVHFNYNEDRTDTGSVAPFNRAPTGISASTPNGFPALLWNISGYPTQTSTHYIVFELRFDADSPCVSNAFNINQLKTPENQKFFILGMRFYPIKRAGYVHPIFQDHIIPATVQAFANNPNNGGFIDYYAGSLDQNAPTTDQGGAGLNIGTWFTTDTIQNNRISDTVRTILFTSPVNAQGNAPCTISCTRNHAISYPAIGTMKKFLDKYYQLPINT